MRDAFAKKLHKLMQKDSSIVILLADLGYTVFDEIEKQFPERIINVGIAEQNMAGVAAGLARAGKRPLIYSIVPFATFRCLEQIRVDLCYNELDVKIVGIGSGFSYGSCGPTHHAIEDVSVMRSLPNMDVIVPSCSAEVESAMDYAFSRKNPVYITLAKRRSNEFKELKAASNLSNQLLKGKEVAVICSGTILENACSACQELKEGNVRVSLFSMPFIKPFDLELMKTIIRDYRAILTIEEHSLIGGLRTAVSEVIAENIHLNPKLIFSSIGIDDCYTHEVGSQNFFMEKAGLSISQITGKIRELVK